MFKLNRAQSLLMDLADGGNSFRQKPKALHAYQPTPPRPRHDRRSRNRFIFMNSRNAMVEVKPRLFKGHRV